MRTVVINIKHTAWGSYEYIGRGRDCTYGNPFRVGVDGPRGRCVAMFRKWLRTGDAQGCANATARRRVQILTSIPRLQGKRLGCHCAPTACHGDVLKWLADHPNTTRRWLRECADKRHRVLVCGGRDYRDRTNVYRVLDRYHRKQQITKLIAGCARGADSIAIAWAKSRNVPYRKFYADWNGQGRAAGHMRNARMLRVGKPNVVIAFPGGAGTADMMYRSRHAGVPVMEQPI